MRFSSEFGGGCGGVEANEPQKSALAKGLGAHEMLIIVGRDETLAMLAGYTEDDRADCESLAFSSALQ